MTIHNNIITLQNDIKIHNNILRIQNNIITLLNKIIRNKAILQFIKKYYDITKQHSKT